jgi:hypothetical protein
MLDPIYELWFVLFQSAGAVATAVALIFVGIQTYFTREQAKSTEHEITTRLRAWVFRIPDEETRIVLDKDKVKISFINVGQLAALYIYFYYTFKNEVLDKEDVENKLDRGAILCERLLLPNETMFRLLTIDRSMFVNYESGSAIYLHILVSYVYAGVGEYEREGRYVGIFKIQKSTLTPSAYSTTIEREWAK